MTEDSDQLRISREVLVSMPSSEDEAYIAIRKSVLNRLMQDVNNLAEPSRWLRDIFLLTIGLCISASFSLWLQSTSLSDIDKVKHWAVIIGSVAFSILCFIFDWMMKDVTDSRKKSITTEIEKLLIT